MRITYPYVTTVTKYKGVYQYDRQKDEWSLFRKGKWDEATVKSYNLPKTFEEWNNVIKNLFPKKYCETIVGTDLQQFDDISWYFYSLNIDWDSLESNLKNGFCIYLADDRTFFMCFEVPDKDYAEEVFASILSETKRETQEWGGAITDEHAGDNYYFIKGEGTAYGLEMIATLFQVDNFIYYSECIYSAGNATGEENFSTLFENLGIFEAESLPQDSKSSTGAVADPLSNDAIIGVWQNYDSGYSFQFLNDGALILINSSGETTEYKYNIYSDTNIEFLIEGKWRLLSYRIDGDYLTISYDVSRPSYN